MSGVASHPAPLPEGLTTGDKCHDAEDPDGILVVVEPTGTAAANYELTAGISVAAIHDDCPPHDEVIVCAYQRDVETSGEPTYHYYPESKLRLYAAGNWTEGADEVTCEHCEARLGSTTGWVEHIATGECPANPQ